MNWRAILFYLMLLATFSIGVFLTFSFVFLFVFQKNFQLNADNLTGLAVGASFLICFFYYFLERKFFPLKKQPQTELSLIGLGNWRPIKIEINTGLDGMPVRLSDGALSPIRLRAAQKNPASDSRPEDYRVEFHNIRTGQIVDYDRFRKDHCQLYQHFEYIVHDFGREWLPQPYSSRWNIAENLNAKK